MLTLMHKPGHTRIQNRINLIYQWLDRKSNLVRGKKRGHSPPVYSNFYTQPREKAAKHLRLYRYIRSLCEQLFESGPTNIFAPF